MGRGRKTVLALGLGLAILLPLIIWAGWLQLHFGMAFDSLGLNAQGYPEFRHRQTGIIFVKLPGGDFWMGAQSQDPNGRNYDPDARGNEGPVHKVTLSPFLIAKYEMSQVEWKGVMGRNPSHFRGSTLPVEQVSWEDCQRFCEKAGLSLPTEAQWEYACRAGTSGPYSGTGRLREMGWYTENSERKTHPVGEKRPNQFGLHDMHGNVGEWCKDAYGHEFYTKPEASRKDPLCTWPTRLRVVRGGRWYGDAMSSGSASRYGGSPSIRSSNVGLRASRQP